MRSSRVPRAVSGEHPQAASQRRAGQQPGEVEGSKAFIWRKQQTLEPFGLRQAGCQQQIAEEKALTHDELDHHDRQDNAGDGQSIRIGPPGDEPLPAAFH